MSILILPEGAEIGKTRPAVVMSEDTVGRLPLRIVVPATDSGLLVFSDGSTIQTGELPDDAREGLEVKFAPKRVKWLVFIPNDIKPSTQNIGLAEIGVFQSH